MNLPGRSLLLIITVIVIIVVVVFLIGLAGMYNGMVAKSQAVDAQCFQVVNQYQRKIDLIPRLVNLTGFLTSFERSTLENVTRLRTQWLNSSGAARVNVSGQIDNLISVVSVNENYPNIQSLWIGAGLFDEIAGTENRIAVERGRYNDRVREYETAIQSFPGVMFAGGWGFHDKAYADPIPICP